MSFFLYILRHAKSDWSGGEADIERPLNKRGRKNAKRMGKWLQQHHHVPEQVLCSSAVRTRETWALISDELKQPEETEVIYDQALYLADSETLLDKVLIYRSAVNSLMLIAHNPGLDHLVSSLSRHGLPMTTDGKLMTTAALALFEYNDADFDPESDRPLSMEIIRPRELD